jgi:hypothetical protein
MSKGKTMYFQSLPEPFMYVCCRVNDLKSSKNPRFPIFVIVKSLQSKSLRENHREIFILSGSIVLTHHRSRQLSAAPHGHHPACDIISSTTTLT